MASPNVKTASPLSKGQPSKYMRDQAQGNGTAALTTPASLALILDRLEGVRPYGHGYTARCPAHKDRTASLSVSAGDDGRLLAHCFAGCAVADIVAAVGLSMADLFPRRLADASPEARRESQAHALRSKLKACANVVELESNIVLIAAGDLERGNPLDEADHNRLATAVERIRAARCAIGGRQ